LINVDDLKNLVNNAQGPVMSLYLQVDPALQENQANIPAWQIWAKNALREYDDRYRKEYGKDWDTIREKINNHLDRYQPSAKGLVIFAGTDIEQVFELPVPIQENAIHFGDPVIVPLLWLTDEYEHYYIVLVDSEEARFLETYLGSVATDARLASDKFTFDYHELVRMPYTTGPRGQNMTYPGGSDRDKFDDMMDEMTAKFHRQVADKLRELLRDKGTARVVIGGPEKASKAVENLLHEEVAKHVVGVMPLPLHESDQQIFQRVMPTVVEYERQKEMELVNQVIDFAKSGGRGALGIDAVKDALDQQRVELLVMPWLNGETNVGLLQDLTIKAMQSSSKFELVHGQAADKLREEGTVAARLYYAI
jgi:hypothetical protein